MDSHNTSDENIRVAATQAVESKLMIKDFIERHSDEILGELETAADKADQGVEFLADAFPIVASVIHVGSNRENYMNALRWAKERLPDSDADSALTALTFLYLVHRGLSERAKDSAKSDLWKTIKSRVDTLLERSTGEEKGHRRIANASASEGESFGLSAETDRSR